MPLTSIGVVAIGRNEGDLVLAGARGPVLLALNISRLPEILRMFAGVDKAMAALA